MTLSNEIDEKTFDPIQVGEMSYEFEGAIANDPTVMAFCQFPFSWDIGRDGFPDFYATVTIKKITSANDVRWRVSIKTSNGGHTKIFQGPHGRDDAWAWARRRVRTIARKLIFAREVVHHTNRVGGCNRHPSQSEIAALAMLTSRLAIPMADQEMNGLSGSLPEGQWIGLATALAPILDDCAGSIAKGIHEARDAAWKAMGLVNVLRSIADHVEAGAIV